MPRVNRLGTYAFIARALPGLLVFHGVVHAQSDEDVLCAVYPPGCPKVQSSTSLDPVTLSLSTEMGRPAAGVRDRVVTFQFPLAYITWGPTIQAEPQSRFTLEAALPDLEPYNTWWLAKMRRGLDADSGRDEADRLHTQLHRQWLPVTLMSYSQSYNVCHAGRCFDTNVELQRTGNRDLFPRLEKSDDDFEYYVSGAKSETTKSYEILMVPKKLEPSRYAFLICDVNKSITYNWCRFQSMFDANISLSYKFEVKHLKDFYRIDEKVRRLIRDSVVNDSHKK